MSNTALITPTRPVRQMKHRLFTSILSIAFLTTLMAVLIVAQYLPSLIEPEVEVRRLSAALPPPPPPPAQPQAQQQQDITLDIAIEGTGAILPNIEVPKTIDIDKPDVPDITMNEVSFVDFTPNIEIFKLNQLDRLPNLLTKTRITMPDSLKKRGVKKVHMRLDITINTTGKVTLNRIVENPYEELNKEIKRLIQRSKFTAPQKEGVAVKARFIWPLDITA